MSDKTRLDYLSLTSDAMKAYFALSAATHRTALDRELGHLVTIRASQLNGCAFCLDMHVKQATIAGERALRLHHLAAWRESPLFTAREQAALAWTEALTNLAAGGVSDALYDQMRAQFSDDELADLSMLVITINGWNRLGVAFQARPGTRDSAFGLDKAGLS